MINELRHKNLFESLIEDKNYKNFDKKMKEGLPAFIFRWRHRIRNIFKLKYGKLA